ncbi:MAG: hypothetical protein KIT33_10810 [Candidatus Kapabacteria bacterium]|nr:hypothetical protein [Ignavibacteriota bacterium]MCW5885451.1 hypothetical protein [Candidatus Kapabacteria bacterium]
MSSETIARESYYSLYRHNLTQYAVFSVLFAITIVIVFFTVLPFIQNTVVINYLEGNVKNKGEEISVSKDMPQKTVKTNYYTRWAIDIYEGSSQEARYWFNPILSLVFPISLFSFLITLMITSNLPIGIGLMRHKIEREILNILDSWHYKIFGNYSEDNNNVFIEKILAADTKDLLNYAEQWEIPPEDLRYFQRVLMWRQHNALVKIFSSWTSLKFYLRFYFTDQYSNLVLGLVYIGAAVLIIIIGMRGLKFIPSTQPSLVFFALGLEFSVLITYAFTVMYSRNDNENAAQTKSGHHEAPPLLAEEFGNNREVENLLRAFLTSNRKKN